MHLFALLSRLQSKCDYRSYNSKEHCFFHRNTVLSTLRKTVYMLLSYCYCKLCYHQLKVHSSGFDNPIEITACICLKKKKIKLPKSKVTWHITHNFGHCFCHSLPFTHFLQTVISISSGEALLPLLPFHVLWIRLAQKPAPTLGK